MSRRAPVRTAGTAPQDLPAGRAGPLSLTRTESGIREMPDATAAQLAPGGSWT